VEISPEGAVASEVGLVNFSKKGKESAIRTMHVRTMFRRTSKFDKKIPFTFANPQTEFWYIILAKQENK
jgi:hypothetical protein